MCWNFIFPLADKVCCCIFFCAYFKSESYEKFCTNLHSYIFSFRSHGALHKPITAAATKAEQGNKKELLHINPTYVMQKQ